MEFLNVAGQAPDQSQFNQEISKRYPYANLGGDYAAPEWTKPLLIQKYSLKEVGECLRFINRLKLHKNQIPIDIEEDIEIERLDDYEIDILKRQWKDQKKVLQKIELIDETGQSIGVFEVPQDLPIRIFKSYFLNTRYKQKQINEVFFFDFNKINELNIKDLIQKNGMSNQIHVSFNPQKFNLFVSDNFNQVQIKLYYLQTNFTLKHLSHMIAQHLIAIKKNADGHSKPEDISSEIWFMNSSHELLYCTQSIRDDQRIIEETQKLVQEKKIQNYTAEEIIKKLKKNIQDRSASNQKTLRSLGISRYYDQLIYSYPSSCNNGQFFVDFRFSNGKDFRFQIGKSEIYFQELISTVIQKHQLFENIDLNRFLNQDNKIIDEKNLIKAKDIIYILDIDESKAGESHFFDQQENDLENSGIFSTITVSVNIQKMRIKDKQIKLIDKSYLMDLKMKIQQFLNIPIIYHNQFKCRVSGKIVKSDVPLIDQMQKQDNLYIIDVDINTIIYLNIMNQNELKLEFDEKTTILDLILNLKPKDFGGVLFDDFKDAVQNRTLVTHNNILVDYDVLISQKFKIGDRLFIQLKINFDRDIEFLVYDKTMALDMLFHLNSIQNDNDSKQIQKVLNELNVVLSKCKNYKKLQALYNSDNDQSFEFLRSIIKTYTDDSFYRVIGGIYRNGNFHQLKNYTFSMINLQLKHGKNIRYQKQKKLYRGVQFNNINIDDYKPNSVHYWPTLTSTSKCKKIAHQFSGFFAKQPCTLFKIYTNLENKPATNIELPQDWSFWNEQEVLLLPFFCFQVIDIQKNKKFNHETIVRIVELPYQNLLHPRQVSYCRAIWIDENVYKYENRLYKTKFENKFKDTEFVCSSTIEQGIDYINNTVKAVVIISGRMGQVLVPRVNHMENLKGIIVFCGNLKFHQSWSSSYAKVKKVADNFDHALQASEQILRDAFQNNY